MIYSKGQRPNLNAGDVIRYQSRLALINAILPEYDRLQYTKMKLVYLDDNSEDVASWRFIDPVGDISAGELKAIMRVFRQTMAVSDAIAQCFAHQAMCEIEEDQHV